MNTPKSVTLVTVPEVTSPTPCEFAYSSHSFGRSSFIEREMRWLYASTEVITASTSSPFWTISDGWLMRRVHDMSEMCTNPSTPGMISTNAPKSVRLRTTPLILLPTLYEAATCSHGLGSVARRDRDRRRFSASTSETTTSTSWPTSITDLGFLTFLVHDISLTWISPSTPSSRTTKAP